MYNISVENGHNIFRKLYGTSKNVYLPEDLRRILETEKEQSLICIHNHPTSGSFSELDLRMFFAYPSYYIAIVVGHNGTLYYMRKRQNVDPSLYASAGLYHWVETTKLYNKYNDAVAKGIMSDEEADLAHRHETMIETMKACCFDYGRILPSKSLRPLRIARHEGY